jgi:hypothetical protein
MLEANQYDQNNRYMLINSLRNRWEMDVEDARHAGVPAPPEPGPRILNGCHYDLRGHYVSGTPECPYCVGIAGGGSVSGYIVTCKLDQRHLIPVPLFTPDAIPLPMKKAW